MSESFAASARSEAMLLPPATEPLIETLARVPYRRAVKRPRVWAQR